MAHSERRRFETEPQRPTRQRALPMATEEQLLLDVAPPTPVDIGAAGVIETEANRAARRLLETPSLWPTGAICLVGPRGSGKSALLRALFRDAPRISAAALAGPPRWTDLVTAQTAVLAEDLDLSFSGVGSEAIEVATFHLINLAAQRGAPLIVSGRRPPAHWRVALRDLRTRLAAMPVARMGAPDAGALAAALMGGFAERGVALDGSSLKYLLDRLDRDFASAARAVERVDALSRRERRPVDRDVIARAMRWSRASRPDPAPTEQRAADGGGPDGNASGAAAD